MMRHQQQLLEQILARLKRRRRKAAREFLHRRQFARFAALQHLPTLILARPSSTPRFPLPLTPRRPETSVHVERQGVHEEAMAAPAAPPRAEGPFDQIRHQDRAAQGFFQEPGVPCREGGGPRGGEGVLPQVGAPALEECEGGLNGRGWRRRWRGVGRVRTVGYKSVFDQEEDDALCDGDHVDERHVDCGVWEDEFGGQVEIWIFWVGAEPASIAGPLLLLFILRLPSMTMHAHARMHKRRDLALSHEVWNPSHLTDDVKHGFWILSQRHCGQRMHQCPVHQAVGVDVGADMQGCDVVQEAARGG